MSKKFYITTPVYYVNDVPHIGHTYTTVAADILARWHRLIGDKTFFLTGTDEHGVNIENKAKQISRNPQQFADEIAAQFQLAWQELNISHDNFLRTSNPDHIKAVEKVLEYMYKKGDIYLGKYEGLYCRGCEQFKSEHDLVNGLCPDHKLKSERVSEECYTFKLSKYQGQLLKKIKSDELKILPAERKNEIISLYEKQGLSDVSFSRKNVSWGIPLPWDKSHTIYVWADAFLNYLTGLGWDGQTPLIKGVKGDFTGDNPPGPLLSAQAGYQGGNIDFWPPDLQLMSKDILRVHATIWPAMLLSLGLPLPKQLFIHGYFLINSQKMSKTIGNVIAPQDLIKKYGVDGTRYLLISAAPFGLDTDISWERFDEKYNADLANGLGNLLARSVTLADKMKESGLKIMESDGKIKTWGDGLGFDFEFKNSWKNYKDCFKKIKLDQAIQVIFGGTGIIKFLDNYITATKPWELIKNKDKTVGVVMYNILERLRHVAWMLWPFMPETADKVWQCLGLDAGEEKTKKFDQAIKWGGLKAGATVKKSEVLFPRI